MKNINRNQTFAFLLLFTISLSSCESAYDKYMAEFKDCVKSKKEEKKLKYDNIQDALNNYDFDAARSYLACHPSKERVLDLFKGIDTSPYEVDLKTIVEAEVAYYISQGELEKAEASASEANMDSLYQQQIDAVFEKNLDKFVERREFDKIHKFLLSDRVQITGMEIDLDTYVREINGSYNKAVREYNAWLEKVLIMYKSAKVNTEEMQNVIDMSLPLIIKSSDFDVSYDGVLSDVFKDEATTKYLKKSRK